MAFRIVWNILHRVRVQVQQLLQLENECLKQRVVWLALLHSWRELVLLYKEGILRTKIPKGTWISKLRIRWWLDWESSQISRGMQEKNNNKRIISIIDVFTEKFGDSLNVELLFNTLKQKIFERWKKY